MAHTTLTCELGRPPAVVGGLADSYRLEAEAVDGAHIERVVIQTAADEEEPAETN